MDRIKTILVATDHTGAARCAEVRAGMLGAELNADMVEVMSARYARAKPTAPSGLPAGAASLHGAFAARRETPAAALEEPRHDADAGNVRALWTGLSPAAIVERAGEIGADLTVVAGKRASFWAGLVTRFRNDELIRLSDRPVLLVNREPDVAYRKVLVGIDFSAESMQAARAALAIAPSAQVTFLHAFHVADEGMMREHDVPLKTIHAFRMRARETARTKLDGFIDALGLRKQAVFHAIEHGMPAPTIHAHADQIHADLIVVGKHGKSRLVDLLLGSVTQRLIDYGHCDLLVTTSPREGEPDLLPAA